MRLIDIDQEMQRVEDLVVRRFHADEPDPEIEAAIEAAVERLKGELDNKADGYAAVITELEGRAAIRKTESQRMATLAKRDQDAADWLRGTLKAVMEGHSIKKIETKRYRLSVVTHGGKAPLVVDDGADIPGEYWRQPPPEIDKTKIRETLETGTVLPFARLGERGTRLAIK